MTKNTKPTNSIIAVLLIGFTSTLIAYLFYPDFLGDDTFIHIGFIKGLLNSEEFSFAGTRTYGSTSPLWVLMGAALSRIFFSPELSIRLLSFLFSFLTIFLAYKTLVSFNLAPKIIYVSIFSLALNPFFLRWALTGMEVSCSMSVFLVIYLLAKSEKEFAPYLIGILFALAMLIRPEFLGFFIIYIIYQFFQTKSERKDCLVVLLVTLILISCWILFTYNYFGTISPNTYVSKAGGSIFGFTFYNAIRSLKLLAGGNLSEFILLSALMLLIVYFIFKDKTKAVRQTKDYLRLLNGSGLVLPILWIAGFYLFYIFKDVIIISRYSLMLVPFLIFFTAFTINYFSKQISERAITFLLILYLAFSLFGYGYVTFTIVKPASDDFVVGFQTTYNELAKIIKEDSENKNVSVALTDVGIIGCYSGSKVYDFAGLVDKSRFDYESSSEYLIAKKPDYLILREDYQFNELLPNDVEYEILFNKKIAGFGINHSAPRFITLYKIFW